MATYALQSPAHAGAAITYSTPASGDIAATGQGIALLVRNPTGGTTITVSLPMLTFDGVVVGPRVVSITSPGSLSNDWLIPLPSSVYGASPITITYTGTLTNVQVALITIP